MPQGSLSELIHRPRRVGLIAVLLVGVVACSSDMGLRQPMTIVNQTGRPVVVTIVGELDEYEELPMTLAPGGGTRTLAGPFHGPEPCMRGSLVATQGGKTLATNDHPCPGSRWERDLRSLAGVADSLVGRRRDPERIFQARRAAVMYALMDTGMDEATAKQWCASWELQVAIDGRARDADYWVVGEAWIAAELRARRLPW